MSLVVVILLLFLFFKLGLFGISKLIEMLRNLVVSPTEGPPLSIFFCFPLVLHWRCSFGDKIIPTPPFFPFVGWVSGPW